MSAFISSKDGVKARKRHYCVLCGELINQGDLHDIRTGVDGGRFFGMRMHPECHAYELVPGKVHEDWYEDTHEPAFDRADAITHQDKSAPHSSKGQ